MNQQQEQLRKLAGELLGSGAVAMVVGWGAGASPGKTAPLFLTAKDQCGQLVWNKYCHNNLAVYLTKPEIRRKGKVALVVKGCDAKAVCGLIQENQVQREEVVLIGMACPGMGDPAWEICGRCDVLDAPHADHRIGQAGGKPRKAQPNPEMEQLRAASHKAKTAFWQKELERCIKCYACRQACPLCYCTRCVVEKNQPQWVPPSTHLSGNFVWNVVRAMHLSGRCVGCNACERACPQGIRLSLINARMAREVEEKFNYRPGYDLDAQPVMRTFDKDDPDGLFK